MSKVKKEVLRVKDATSIVKILLKNGYTLDNKLHWTKLGSPTFVLSMFECCGRKFEDVKRYTWDKEWIESVFE